MHGMEDNPEALQRKFVNAFAQQAHRTNLQLNNDPNLAFHKIMNNTNDEYFRHPVYHLAYDFHCISEHNVSLLKAHNAFNESSKRFTREEQKTIFPFHHQHINQ